jgi:hypothetical protein
VRVLMTLSLMVVYNGNVAVRTEILAIGTQDIKCLCKTRGGSEIHGTASGDFCQEAMMKVDTTENIEVNTLGCTHGCEATKAITVRSWESNSNQPEVGK